MRLLFLFPAATIAILFNQVDRSQTYDSCDEIDSLLIDGSDRTGLFVREKFKLNSTDGPRWTFCVFDVTGAWTVVQKRFDGSVNFNQTWHEYKNGFGRFDDGDTKDFEYWIGLNAIYNLTNPFGSKLRVLLRKYIFLNQSYKL